MKNCIYYPIYPYLTTTIFMVCFLSRINMLNCVIDCFFSHAATCEMCGMVGVRDAFYSKTKRFCSVSCSRSYSSNSKKASILARLQVTTHGLKKHSKSNYYLCCCLFLPLSITLTYCICSFILSRVNHQQKRLKSYKNSH